MNIYDWYTTWMATFREICDLFEAEIYLIAYFIFLKGEIYRSTHAWSYGHRQPWPGYISPNSGTLVFTSE